jgi:hypothetical protein
MASYSMGMHYNDEHIQDVVVTFTNDENGNQCFLVQDSESKNNFLSSLDDKKHIFWNNTAEPWNWEHWYLVKIWNNKYIAKSYWHTTMYYDEDENCMWQCDYDENAENSEYVIFQGDIPESPPETEAEAEEEEEE